MDVRGVDLVARILTQDADIAAQRHQRDLVLGLTSAHPHQRLAEANREASDLEVQELGGEEVAELVNRHQAADQNQEVENRHGAARLCRVLSCLVPWEKAAVALSSDFRKQQTSQDLEEQLESLEKLLERTKVLFEQYFMGIQKIAPTQLHREVERRVRELTQNQVRNTALRFRLTTLTQKFGSYNTYWKRTLRQIEQGTYIRDLARVSRKALAQGEDLPEELLVKLPKLVQSRIRRDRARLAARAQEQAAQKEALDGADQAPDAGAGSRRPGSHITTEIGENDAAEAEALFKGGDLDMDQLFGGLTQDGAAGGIEPADSQKRTQAIEPIDLPGGPPATDPADSRKRTQALSQRLTQVFEPPDEGEGGEQPGKTGAVPRTTIPLVPPPPGERPAAGKTIRFAPPAAGEGKAAGAGTAPARAPAPPRIPPPIKRTQVLTPPPVPRAPPRAAGGPPPPAPPAGMDEKQCRDLYTRYIKAKKLVGEKTDGISYDKLVSSLGKQAPTIMKQHGARGVQYSVVVRGEKVILKAKPIK